MGGRRVEPSSAPGRSSRPLQGRVVGVYGSAGAPWHHLGLAAAFGADVRPVRAEDIAAGRLGELDVFVMPGGGAVAMAGMLAPLGQAGALAIRHWVEEGGTYVSSCAGSVLPLALEDEAAKALPVASCMRMTDVPLANPGDATLGGLASPGVGRIRVRVDAEHPLGRGLPPSVDLVHYNGPFFDMTTAPHGAIPFAWPVESLERFTPAERFLPPAGEAASEPTRSERRSSDVSDLTVDRCIRRGAATAVDVEFGAGRVVLFGSHPEFGLGPLALGWGEGARLLVAALAGDGQARPGRRAANPGGPSWNARPARPADAPAELACSVAAAMRNASERFAALAPREAGGWLDDDKAPSLNGRSPREAWRIDCTFAAAALAAAAEDVAGFADRVTVDDAPWLDDVPRDDQDFGWMGLVQVVDRIHRMLDRGEAALVEPPQRPAHAYDLFETHPFHLVVGTYLSAAGLAAGAVLTTLVLACRVGAATPACDLVLWRRADDRVAA